MKKGLKGEKTLGACRKHSGGRKGERKITIKAQGSKLGEANHSAR